jgi:hypothetical protein
MSAALLANVVNGIVVAAKPAVTDVLPASSELDTQLTSDPHTWTSMLVRVLDVYVDPLFTSIPAAPVPGAPASASIAWNTAAQIRKVMTDPATVAAALPATNHLPQSKVDNLSWKLRSFQRGADVQDALDSYLAYMVAGSLLPPALVASQISAKRAIRDLVALEAFLVRISSAIAAASAVQVSLAEALCMYRVEGDLITPVSEAHWVDRLPVNELTEIQNLGQIDTGNVRDTLRRGLWSYPYKALAVRFAIPAAALPAAGPERDAVEMYVKCFALTHWLLLIGGLDVVAKTVGTIDPVRFGDGVIKFVHDYRIAVGLPSLMPDRIAEFDAVFGSLKCTWPANENGVVVVTTDAPVLLSSFALGLALLVFRRDYAHGGGPFIQPPPGLEYLAYHVQADRVAKVDDRFLYVLASAAVAAARSSNSDFAQLKLDLSTLALPTTLHRDPMRGEDPAEHISVFDKLTAAPARFLDDPTKAGRLAEFIILAEAGDWSAYPGIRGNVARYRKLLEFYKALLA